MFERALTLSISVLAMAVVVPSAQVAPSSAPSATEVTKEIFVPAGLDGAYDGVHYAPVVRVGNMVILSGIPAAGPGEFEDQLRRMFGQIKINLAAAGASLEDVVELESFHHGSPDTAAFRAEFSKVRAIHGEFFKSNYPAWTAVGNAVLLSPNALVEMRAVAIVGSGKNVRLQRGEPASILGPKPD
jgi:enamine deaminase RidA (YjgF/YER057c/UK114 family)